MNMVNTRLQSVAYAGLILVMASLAFAGDAQAISYRGGEGVIKSAGFRLPFDLGGKGLHVKRYGHPSRRSHGSIHHHNRGARKHYHKRRSHRPVYGHLPQTRNGYAYAYRNSHRRRPLR